jgi:hypothetical protein
MKKIRIGWCVAETPWSDLLQSAPEPVRHNIPCPVIGAWTGVTYLVRAPFDIHVECFTDSEGMLDVRWLDGSPRADVHEVLSFSRPNYWAAPDRPAVLWMLRNLFVADEPVWLEACAPMLHIEQTRWPGVAVPLRYNIHEWARPLPWVFDWQDRSQPIRIRRGDPLQYVRFMVDDPDARFEIEQIPFDDELRSFVKLGSEMMPFQRHRVGLGKALLGRRPRRWLG